MIVIVYSDVTIDPISKLLGEIEDAERHFCRVRAGLYGRGKAGGSGCSKDKETDESSCTVEVGMYGDGDLASSVVSWRRNSATETEVAQKRTQGVGEGPKLRGRA